MPEDRRTMDEGFRRQLGERLAQIETSQKLYHDEVKSIVESLHRDLGDIKVKVERLHHTLYGGPDVDSVGLLERFRSLLWKAGIATTITLTLVTLGVKILSPALERVFLSLVKP